MDDDRDHDLVVDDDHHDLLMILMTIKMTNLVVGGAVERAGGELRPDLEPKSKVRFGVNFFSCPEQLNR